MVTGESQLVGVVSYSDLERAIMEGKGELPVRACLQHNMFLVSPSTNLRQIEVRAAEIETSAAGASERESTQRGLTREVERPAFKPIPLRPGDAI